MTVCPRMRTTFAWCTSEESVACFTRARLRQQSKACNSALTRLTIQYQNSTQNACTMRAERNRVISQLLPPAYYSPVHRVSHDPAPYMNRLLDSILGPRLSNALPLHISHGIGAAALQRKDVIDNVAARARCASGTRRAEERISHRGCQVYNR
jgi:hypothetical protein